MLHSNQQAFEAFKKVPLFEGLDDATLRGIANLAEIRDLKTGQVLLRQGETGDEFFVIQKGSLRLSARADGSELTLGVLGPGEYLGEMSLIDQFPRSATAVALEGTSVLALGRAAFCSLVVEKPDLAQALLKGLARRLRKTNQDAAAIANMTVYRRLARKLLDLASSHGKETDAGVRVGVPLSMDTLASMVASDASGVKLLVELLEHEGVLTREQDHFVIHKVRPLLDPEFPYKLS